MSFEVDEEILQDFLIEAAEILEQLSEQLVELENNPEDADLLNAIFRGFHTVKGGAGFLSLTTLVDACHGAENVFDTLRNGGRRVTPELMDIILQSLDTINEMFECIKNRTEPDAADPELLSQLHKLSLPEAADSEPVESEPVAATSTPVDENSNDTIDEISEEEFDRLLDELHGTNSAPSATPPKPVTPAPADVSAGNDDISDDEFERLLDELHGQGKFVAPKLDSNIAASTSASDEIDDDEFESLLDELHGKGNSPKAQPIEPPKVPEAVNKVKPAAATKSNQPAAPTAPATAEKATVKPASKPENKPATAKAPAAPQAETTVRVDTKRLDQIMNMVGELVLVRNRLVSLGININDEVMSKAIGNLDVVTGDLQGAVMKTRMQPIKKVFGRFPRVVRDMARSLNKEITLDLEGEDTDLDKNLVEALADPLVHLVRNSVDHGIEMPDAREAAGKPRMGRVSLSAAQEGDHILLTIADDGGGMDPEKLKQIAISRGVLDADAAARMSDNDAYNLIFAPGFSTKTEISDISGRGVGMDVVKTKIAQLNGSVHIDSELGKGTVLEIKVPLTLAILPTLMVIVGEQTFALPLATVNEIINLNLEKTNIVDGQQTVIVREKAIPLFYLEHWLVKGADKTLYRNKGHVVVVQQGSQQVGFVVDGLIGQEEVVIKPLDELLQGTPGMAGATITSDGGIALILDVPSMLKHYAKKSKVLERSKR